jgi:elongation factor Tu
MTQQREHTHRRLPICTLGAHGHGKTTLTAAIAKVVARIGAIHTNGDSDFEAQTPISHPIREGVGITYRAIAYETSGKLYTQIDCETHIDVVKMLISGSPTIQGAIWIVNAVEGITPDAEAHLRLASQMQLPTVLSFLNTGGIPNNDELIDICQQEMEELLNACGRDAETAPIIVGDARKALDYRGDSITSTQWQPIVDLIFAMNRAMPTPMDTARLPLIMPIHEITEETKESVFVRGDIVQGQLAVGQAVDIVGKGDRIKTRVLSIKENEVCVESEPDWLSVGQVLCTPKTVKSHAEFTTLIYLLTHEESGTHIPLIENDRPDIYLWGTDMPAHLKLPPSLSLITPGTYAHVALTLDLPLVMEVGTRFEVKKMGVRIGFGLVTGVE